MKSTLKFILSSMLLLLCIPGISQDVYDYELIYNNSDIVEDGMILQLNTQSEFNLNLEDSITFSIDSQLDYANINIDDENYFLNQKVVITPPPIPDNGFNSYAVNTSSVDYKFCPYHQAMEIVNPQIPDHGYTAYYDVLLDITLVDINGKLSMEIDRPKPPQNGFKSY